MANDLRNKKKKFNKTKKWENQFENIPQYSQEFKDFRIVDGNIILIFF